MNHCTRMNDGKLYLSNSMVMDSLYNNIIKPMNDYIIPIELDRSLDICQQIYINGPAHTVYNTDNRGLTKTVNTGPAHTVYNTDYRGLTKTVNTGPAHTIYNTD